MCNNKVTSYLYFGHCKQGCGSGCWKRSYFNGSGSAKSMPLVAACYDHAFDMRDPGVCDVIND